MKISKAELQQIIKEEAVRIKKIISLKKELSSIDKQLSEVHAGGSMDSDKNDGVHAGQKTPVFKKKGSALIEDEMDECGDGMTPGIMETEDELEMSDEMGGDEMGGDEMGGDEMGGDEMEGEETDEIVVLEPEEATEKIMSLEAEVAEIKEKVDKLVGEESEEESEEDSMEDTEGDGSLEEYAEQQPDRDMDGDGKVDAADAAMMKESMEAKAKSKSIISEELSRMKKLAGI